MAVSITVRDGSGQIVEAIELGLEGIEDMTGLFESLIDPWTESRRHMFESSGASTGTRWADYTDEERQYAAIKSSIHGRRLNRRDLLRWKIGNERLKPSMDSKNHPEFIGEARKRSLTLGTRVPYADNHDRGQGRAPDHLGGGQIERRRLLAFGRPFETDVAVAASEYAGSIEAGIELKTQDVLARPLLGL